MIPKLFSVRLINELESVVAARVFYGCPELTEQEKENKDESNQTIYEEYLVKINCAHFFEKIEKLKTQTNNTTTAPSMEETTSLNDEEESRYHIDKIQVIMGEGKEEKVFSFNAPFLTHDSIKETFVMARDRKGEVVLRLLRDREMTTKYC